MNDKLEQALDIKELKSKTRNSFKIRQRALKLAEERGVDATSYEGMEFLEKVIYEMAVDEGLCGVASDSCRHTVSFCEKGKRKCLWCEKLLVDCKMQDESARICPECGKLAEYRTYFRQHECIKCNWRG